MSTRQAWQRSITDDQGNLLTGVQISVFQQDGITPATIYSGLTDAAMPNPFNTGVQTVARFYADPGLYVIRAFKAGVGTQEWLNVDISGWAVREDLPSAAASTVRNTQSVTLFGDSFAEAFSFNPPPYNGDQLSISVWRFVAGRFGNALRVIKNAGVSGNTAAQMLARYDTDVKPFRSDWVFFNCGVNDFYGFGRTAEAVFSDVQTILQKLRADGYKVLMVNCPPQVSTRSGHTPAKAAQCARYNELIAGYAASVGGVVLVDIYSALINWADTTNAGARTEFYGSDGIHLSVLGTIECARVIHPAMLPFFAPDTSQTLSPLNTGIGGTESILLGTGGSNLTGSSGDLAAGWTSRRVSGTNGTIVCSKLPSVGQRQTITLAASNGDSRFRLNNDLDAEFAAHLGKVVTTTVRGRMRTVAGGVHLKELVAKLYLFDGTNIVNATNGAPYSGYSPLADAVFDTGEVLLELRGVQVPANLNDSGVYIELLLNSVTGGTVELDIYGVEIREAP